MFHLGRDNVPFGRICLQRGGDGGVVTLRRARGENHIHRVRANQLRHLFARRLDNRLEFRTELVRAGRIAPFRREVRHHRFQHLGQDGSGRVVVEVNHKVHPTHGKSRAQEPSNRLATEVRDPA